MRAVLCRRELTESGVQKWLLSMWKACSSSRFHEKQLSLTRENQKSAEDTFPRLGKRENVENRLSQHWEDRKTAKKCFPKLGKNKKSQRLYFPTLGRTKNIVGSFSNPLDGRFFLFSIHPRPRTSILMRSFPPIRLLFGVVNSRVSCRITNRNAAELIDLIRVYGILGIPRTIWVCIYRI